MTSKGVYNFWDVNDVPRRDKRVWILGPAKNMRNLIICKLFTCKPKRFGVTR